MGPSGPHLARSMGPPGPCRQAPATLTLKTSQAARLHSAGSILRTESGTMTPSPERTGLGRRVGRYDKWIMVTGVAMFLLSFAPWEGLNPETLGNLGGLGLGGLGNVPVTPGS